MLDLPVPAEAAAGGILYFADACAVLYGAYDLANGDELRGGLQLWAWAYALTSCLAAMCVVVSDFASWALIAAQVLLLVMVVWWAAIMPRHSPVAWIVCRFVMLAVTVVALTARL